MKKCPTCDKTFEDSMRFCQVDGTLLVDDEPAFDPYATIVAAPIPTEYIAPPEAEAPVEEPESPIEEAAPDEDVHYTVGSIPISEPDDVLDLPSADPLKTMYVSESEMQAALGTEGSGADIMDIPPAEEVSQPEPPSFIAPESPVPSFAEPAPPPSPFSIASAPEEPAASVFEAPVPAEPVFDEPAQPAYEQPAPPSFNEAATMIQPGFNSPFDPPPAPVAEWTPPPAPDASWQNQEIGSSTPFQPPPAAMAGQNKTLAIVSLVSGIVGLLCCSGFFVVGLAAVVTGFMARGKASSNPAEYGGGGLALGGIITGAISILFGVLYWILVFLQVVALPNM